MTNLTTQQQAIADIEFLKKTLLDPKGDDPVNVESLYTHMLLNIAAGGAVLLLTIFESMTGSITSDLLVSKMDPVSLQIMGLVNVATFLAVAIVGFFALIEWRARKEGKKLHEFASRHFVYYRNFSIIADMLVKFITFSLIILAGKPEWIAALLVIFTGDLVIHGRLFYLPLKQSTIFGALCFAIGIGMLFLGVTSINASFAVFLGITLVSAANLWRLYAKISTDKSHE